MSKMFLISRHKRPTYRSNIIITIIIVVVSLFNSLSSIAQGDPAVRYEIDAKRLGVDPVGDDALARSREFIRLDSTYYVGYLIEGLYKAEHSSDKQGFVLAIKPLDKALQLMLGDYEEPLRYIYQDKNIFNQYIKVYQDLLILCTNITTCYDNTDQPNKTIDVCNLIDHFNFPKDYFGTYSRRAWTYHRYRTFNSKDFSFLKDNIKENEAMALQQCYTGLSIIEDRKAENDAMFGSGQAMNDQLTIYHYLAFLESYNKRYDSSEYYYNILAKHGMISWNNYAGMQHEIGHFRAAMEYFKKDLYSHADYTLKEPAFFIPMLQVYANKPSQGISMTEEVIHNSGSTPGFGWYNIALSRSFLYNGQLDSCEWALNKARNFKEVHIGTTLTQEQYNFSIGLLQYQLIDRKIQFEKFVHKRWYFSLSGIWTIVQLEVEKFIASYIVNNMLANNGDKERLFYDLFCSESTTTFDEAWYLMKDNSSSYLVKKYHDYITNDKRNDIKRYFQLMEAQLTREDGDTKTAQAEVQQLLTDKNVDVEYEQLFLARLYELAAKLSKDAGNRDEHIFYQSQLLKIYPQMIPYSEDIFKARLSISDSQSDAEANIRDAMFKTSINWTSNTNVPTVRIIISGGANNTTIAAELLDSNGQLLKTSATYNYKYNATAISRSLLAQLFTR